jgi:hypothetical protein
MRGLLPLLKRRGLSVRMYSSTCASAQVMTRQLEQVQSLHSRTTDVPPTIHIHRLFVQFVVDSTNGEHYDPGRCTYVPDRLDSLQRRNLKSNLWPSTSRIPLPLLLAAVGYLKLPPLMLASVPRNYGLEGGPGSDQIQN